MPGPVPFPSPVDETGAGLAVFAGYIRPSGRSQNQVDAACASLARRADNIDQIAAFVGELAVEARNRVSRFQILLDGVQSLGKGPKR